MPHSDGPEDGQAPATPSIGYEQARDELAEVVRRLEAGGTSLEDALTLSEPEGYVRVFLDEGPPMATLLSAAADQGVARERARHLLSSLTQTVGSTPARQGGAVRMGMVEPLSGRELDVLRLLRTDMNGPDIARELMVSLNTMRTHTKSIFTKLGVNNRRAAVRRAEELGL